MVKYLPNCYYDAVVKHDDFSYGFQWKELYFNDDFRDDILTPAIRSCFDNDCLDLLRNLLQDLQELKPSGLEKYQCHLFFNETPRFIWYLNSKELVKGTLNFTDFIRSIDNEPGFIHAD